MSESPLGALAPREKRRTLLTSGLFALVWGAFGVGGGVLPLAQMSSMAWSARSWVPVEARLTATNLESRRGSKGGTRYSVSAHYVYLWQGKEYGSRRVGLGEPDHMDGGLDDWHQRWHGELSSAMSQKRPVRVWVNPAVPSNAIIDKHVRWSAFLLYVLFVPLAIAAGSYFVLVLLNRVPPWRSSRGRRGRSRDGRDST